MICKRCHAEMPQNALYCPFCGRGILTTPKAKKRPNGAGTAFKRNNTWTAQVTKYIYTDSNGRKTRKYLTKGGFSTKGEALAYLETLRAGESKTVPTLLELYSVYETNELTKLSKDKQTAYKKARERLEPIIGRKIDSLTTSDLQAAVNSKASTYYTARDMKILLSHLYKRAAVDQFVNANLAQYIVLPTLEEKEATPFTEAEVKTMWAAFANGDTFIGYLLLMIYSGMMPAELFACKKSMINYDKCEIVGCGKKTKTRKTGVIAYADCVSPVLQELCALYDGEKLFPKHETAFYDMYHEATKRIGIRDLPPYSCRHTTGTEAAKLGLNASTIQKIMRHAKITTSQRYIHLGDNEVHNGLNAMTNG